MTATPRAAGLIYGPESHYLDHLAPLCSLLNIPLLVTEEAIFESAKAFYPGLTVQYFDYPTITESLVKNFEIIFHCSIRDLFDEIFFFAQKLGNKKIHTIWCPHGNSDKGHTIFYMEALRNEEVALVYGHKMIDFLKEKGAFDNLKAYVQVGNYRLTYYEAHKLFYDNLIKDKIVRKLPVRKKNIFYAPTWNDYEKSSSFYDAITTLIEKLPEAYNLIIKLHSNLKQQDPFGVEKLLMNYEDRNQVLFLDDFPAIYPILDFVDIYIGDASSIGYDFLHFNKPLLLLNQNNRDVHKDPGLYLFKCGIEIRKDQYHDIYKILSAYLPSDVSYFSEVRKKVYKYTFGDSKSASVLKKEIEALYKVFPDKDLNFY